MKNVFSKQMLFLVATTSLVLVFLLSTWSNNYNSFLNLIPRTRVGVKQGCYKFYSLRTHEPLEADELVKRNCSKSHPSVIIMGAKKCGTTALKDFLSFHPQIATTSIEPHFFDKYYYLGLSWYLDQLPYATPDQLILEKTPKYLVDPFTPGAIQRDLGSNVKFILILRDPVQRAVSDFVHLIVYDSMKESPPPTEAVETFDAREKRLFRESITNMEPLLTDKQKQIRRHVKQLQKEYYKSATSVHVGKTFDTFEETVLLSDGKVNTNIAIIDTGIYIKHIKKWLEIYPKTQFLILDGEEFVFNPLPGLQKVQSFLNISNFFTNENFYFDKMKRFFCLAKPIRSCMTESKGRVHPYVKQDVLKKLYNFYRPYNIELKELLQLNFTWLE